MKDCDAALRLFLVYGLDIDDEVAYRRGPAGSGKTSFTVRLCCALDELGLRPIRVELKNLSTRQTKDVWEALPEAVELGDQRRSPRRRLRGDAGLFLGNRIFEDRVPFRFGEQTAGPEIAGPEICPYVLILDGWDEISASASQGYQQELLHLLNAVRDELFRNPDRRVRVILAGRPTGVVGQSALVRSTTRILTLRDMEPSQLSTLISRFRKAAVDKPTPVADLEPWDLENAAEVLESILSRYGEEHAKRVRTEERVQPSDSGSDRLEVLGLPLLAHLTLRLVAENPETAQTLIDDMTALYRSLVDLVIEKAGKPVDAREREKDEPVITGPDLRHLLQETAAAMTVLDVRSISREELMLRLGKSFEELDAGVQALGKDRVLGRLLISFFFKGGHPELGCEFSHKSFREYLFAEKIVERLKNYGRQAQASLPLRVRKREPYWQDFPSGVAGDGRYELSRDLALRLGPQWLTSEESTHLRKLLQWDIVRTSDTASEKMIGQPAEILGLDGWLRVRDGLADLWEWWGEGVHLRPLPETDRRRNRINYAVPLAAEVAERSTWQSLLDKELQAPKRAVTIDAHLGDALFMLCAVVHSKLIMQRRPPLDREDGAKDPGPPRPYQAWLGDHVAVRFAPSGANPEYFLNFIARINSCGYRPAGLFPSTSFCREVDAESAALAGADFSRANLTGANLTGANLTGANLAGANLTGANLADAFFVATISFSVAGFYGQTGAVDFSHANLTDANLTDANLTGVRLAGANLAGANLANVSFDRANLTGANLTGANLAGASLTGASFTGANLYRSEVTTVQLQETLGVPRTLPDGTTTKSADEYQHWLEEHRGE